MLVSGKNKWWEVGHLKRKKSMWTKLTNYEHYHDTIMNTIMTQLWTLLWHNYGHYYDTIMDIIMTQVRQ